MRALASRYLAFVEPRVRRRARALPQLHVVLAPAGPRSAARRTATAARSGRSAPSSAARPIPGGRASPATSSTPRCRRSRTSRARARGRTRCSASTSTCAPSRATATCRRCAQTLAERLLDLLPAHEPRRLAVVRGPRHLLQRAPAAGAARRPGARMRRRGDDRRRRCARSSGWSRSSARADGYFAPIGSNGFYRARRAAARVRPAAGRGVRAWSRPASRRTASPATRRWREHARRAFNWFLGQNQLQQSLYDPRTGGCRDGLHADRVNENQGAESTLSFLLALLEMRAGRSRRSPRDVRRGDGTAMSMTAHDARLRDAAFIATRAIRS